VNKKSKASIIVSSQLKEAEQKIAQLVNYDFLTELPNRTMFTKQGEQILALAKHNKQICAVFCMDIDRFKMINESMGYEAGNELLKQIVSRFKEYPDDGEVLARLGGDEFSLIKVDISHEDVAALLAQDIIEKFAVPFIIHGQDVVVGISIGIGLSDLGDNHIDELSKDAQTAMHKAKQSGGNTYQFYSSEMTEKVKRRLSLESHLRRALERKEFMLYYQPKVSTKTGKIAGAEALIRWQHPERGLVSPMEFVSVLEDTGLIVPVGEWALEEICNQYTIWNQMGFGNISLALNLSAKQFVDTGLCEKVRQTLEKMGPNPDFLELEVTESILMGDFQSATKTLEDLHALGIKLSIDDFGTGYSSLAYLKLLPVDVLKIDRAFVMGLPDDVQDNAIVRVILLLAKALNLKVVAEGVETKEQLDFLINEQCDYIQGYYYSKPIPSEQFTRLLQKH
jgi:diguanylate cyclase (GGDEF)-like protein